MEEYPMKISIKATIFISTLIVSSGAFAFGFGATQGAQVYNASYVHALTFGQSQTGRLPNTKHDTDTRPEKVRYNESVNEYRVNLRSNEYAAK